MPALSGGPRYRETIARQTIHKWLTSRSPFTDEMPYYWQSRFEIAGRFWAAATFAYETEDWAVPTYDKIQPLTFPPPWKLYRAARDDNKHHWSWTSSYEAARRIANSRGRDYSVWSTENPKRVYGCIDLIRTFDKFGYPGASDDINVWIVEPGDVKLESRWSDPNDIASLKPEWADRGVSEAQALAIIDAWCTHNPNDRSAVDNFDRAYWTELLNSIGQFAGLIEIGQPLKITPTRDIKPATVLYRAATDEYADSIAWTTELHAAEKYLEWRGPNARIWTGTPTKVYGRIWWHGIEMRAPYFEWFADCTDIRPYEGPEA